MGGQAGGRVPARDGEDALTEVVGTVGVVADDLARYTDFAVSLATLRMPAGTRVAYAKGSSVAANHNVVLREAEGDWLWILGDDHVFAADTLELLLAAGADAAVPLVLRRGYPFTSVAYVMRDGELAPAMPFPGEATLELDAAGSAGLLLRRPVLDALLATFENPFEDAFGPDGRVGGDLVLTGRIRALGFGLVLVAAARMGHMRQATLMPELREDGSWGIEVGLGDEFAVHLPGDRVWV